jgi:predicted ATPase with chaperone activity
MALLTKTHKVVQPNALASELADAREAYIATRTSVIDRAVQRQNAIEETISDLESEDRILETIVADAQKG